MGSTRTIFQLRSLGQKHRSAAGGLPPATIGGSKCAKKRYSLGTKNKNLKRNPDGSLTLYAGAESSGGDNEANWLPAPEGHFSLYIRAYWGKLAKSSGLIPYKPTKAIPSSAMAYRLLVIREAL
jgi:hypothetical protein